MKIQLLFVALFVFNLLLVWLTALTGRFVFYRWFARAAFVALPLSTGFFNQPRFELDYFWWRVVGVAAIVAGLALLGWAKFDFRPGEAPPELITAGPYQFVRHPIYLAFVFIFTGWWWLWAGVYAFYSGMFILLAIWAQGYLEEKLILEKKFGEKYRDYKKRAGMYWVK